MKDSRLLEIIGAIIRCVFSGEDLGCSEAHMQKLLRGRGYSEDEINAGLDWIFSAVTDGSRVKPGGGQGKMLAACAAPDYSWPAALFGANGLLTEEASLMLKNMYSVGIIDMLEFGGILERLRSSSELPAGSEEVISAAYSVSASPERKRMIFTVGQYKNNFLAFKEFNHESGGPY